MPKVIHLLTESEPFSESYGGAISRWAANVLREDESSLICAPWFDESWGFDAARLRGLDGLRRYKTIKDAMRQRVPWPLRRRLIATACREVMEELRPGDVVWVHNRPEYVAALRDKVHRHGATIVLHMHNSHLLKWQERFDRAPGADLYVFVSEFLRSEAMEHGIEMRRSEVLYNGADTDVFYPGGESVGDVGAPTVLFAGRLVPEKGVHVFVEAMRVLEERRVGLQGVIAGSSGFGGGAETEYVVQLRARVGSSVRFEGYKAGAEMGEVFRSADIFCLPSCWHDPFPLAVLEAMACRLPVVATRSGGIPEALTYGGGMLVERGSVSELATALAHLAGRADERRRVGAAGYASFRGRFTWDCVRQKYGRILESLCSEEAFGGSGEGRRIECDRSPR